VIERPILDMSDPQKIVQFDASAKTQNLPEMPNDTYCGMVNKPDSQISEHEPI
jgi:hypothetical protein